MRRFHRVGMERPGGTLPRMPNSRNGGKRAVSQRSAYTGKSRLSRLEKKSRVLGCARPSVSATFAIACPPEKVEGPSPNCSAHPKLRVSTDASLQRTPRRDWGEPTEGGFDLLNKRISLTEQLESLDKRVTQTERERLRLCFSLVPRRKVEC